MSEERDGVDRPHGGTPGKPLTPGKTMGGTSFEDRLAQARRKRGLAASQPGNGDESSGGGLSSSQGNALGMGLRVGVELVSALAVAVAIGWFLDRWLHTTPFLLMLFVVLGGAAGVANVWRLVGPRKAPPPD